ncbi:hypothetical protein HPB47_006057 [Ixodes persulcatus]|uniref:Uncharacterized protein n=1 Tax=Ixodes persulcatus TaxID=34615 RepID=A0AC60PBA9_IXOPE|nr:hypothetical protein HPB47_006057 [Ixodes persulcatus]
MEVERKRRLAAVALALTIEDEEDLKTDDQFALFPRFLLSPLLPCPPLPVSSSPGVAKGKAGILSEDGRGTGGGPPRSSPLTPEEEGITGIFGVDTVQGCGGPVLELEPSSYVVRVRPPGPSSMCASLLRRGDKLRSSWCAAAANVAKKSPAGRIRRHGDIFGGRQRLGIQLRVCRKGLCNDVLALLRVIVLLKRQATSVAEVDWRAVPEGGSSKPRGSRLYDARKRPRDLSETQDAIHRLGSDLCTLGDSPFAKHLRTVQILGTESTFGRGVHVFEGDLPVSLPPPRQRSAPWVRGQAIFVGGDAGVAS